MTNSYQDGVQFSVAGQAPSRRLKHELLQVEGEHPPVSCWVDAFTATYDWGDVEGVRMRRAGLFIHQLSHCFIDFRGIADAPMRAASSDYFENSRRATLAQSGYALRNPHGFDGYAEDCWGFTACEGPGPEKFTGGRLDKS